MEHHTRTKVYFIDGDAAGVVHYARYLRFFEIGRIDMLDDCGIDLYDFHREEGFFVISKIGISFKAPAVPGDEIDIYTTVTDLKRASMELRQRIYRKDRLLVEANLTMAVLKNNRPVRMPEVLKRLPSTSCAGVFS